MGQLCHNLSTTENVSDQAQVDTNAGCYVITYSHQTNGTTTPWGWVQTKTTYCTKPSAVYPIRIQPCGCDVPTTMVCKCFTSRISLTHRGMSIWTNTTSWTSSLVMTKRSCTTHVFETWLKVIQWPWRRTWPSPVSHSCVYLWVIMLFPTGSSTGTWPCPGTSDWPLVSEKKPVRYGLNCFLSYSFIINR